MVDVEFRIGEVDGTKLTRSIYSDLVNLPDPIYLGASVRIFNYDGVPLYMRVDGYASGWTFTSNDLGVLGSGANIYKNIDNFGTRAKPAAATTESITIRLRAYTDAAYTILKWTFERVINAVFIKSDDGSWTQDFLYNFDDGTLQGWGVVDEGNNVGGFPTLVVAGDFCLSVPFSAKMTFRSPAGGGWEPRGYMHRSLTTPNRNNVFCIFDFRVNRSSVNMHVQNIQIRETANVLLSLGKPFDGFFSSEDRIPLTKWMRIVAPLPKNTAISLRLSARGADQGTDFYVWADDIRVISKD